MKEGRLQVFEAVGPVRFTPIEKWIDRGVGRQVVVKRLRDAAPLTVTGLAKMRAWAARVDGRPYDLAFGWDDEKLYCSELVWKLYKAAAGLPLCPTRPLQSYDLSSDVVKALMRERYGDRIPLGEPVVAPVDLYQSRKLYTVESR